MTTARLNPRDPALLNGVTKRYGENTILNALDLHIPTGQFVAVVGAQRAAAKVPCCVCWPGSKNPMVASCWPAQRRWRRSRKTVA